jgi:hypothetical protein
VDNKPNGKSRFKRLAAQAMSIRFPKEAEAAGVYEQFPEFKRQSDGSNKTN